MMRMGPRFSHPRLPLLNNFSSLPPPTFPPPMMNHNYQEPNFNFNMPPQAAHFRSPLIPSGPPENGHMFNNNFMQPPQVFYNNNAPNFYSNPGQPYQTGNMMPYNSLYPIPNNVRITAFYNFKFVNFLFFLE